MSVETCIEWATESNLECLREENRGYNECALERDFGYSVCCNWAPCSWVCSFTVWISNIVCVAWTWVSNIVCVSWTLISNTFCVGWAIAEAVFTPVTWLLTWITAIPVIGRLIDLILNIAQSIVWRSVGLGGSIIDIVGIKALKRLRICVIILVDEEGNETVSRDADGIAVALEAEIENARQILRDEANIVLVVEDIHTVHNSSPKYALDVGCDGRAFGEDFLLTGSYFEATANMHCVTGGLGKITGFSPTITVFCVRDIPGTTIGCALGPLTDYLTIEGSNPGCLAHEIGHKIGLWHCCNGTNLANGICGGTVLEHWQTLIVRNSKYVTYF